MLSGGNLPLALSEFRASCEAEGAALEMVEDFGKLLRIRGDLARAVRSARRCSFSRCVCREVARLPGSPDEAPKLERDRLGIKPGETFMVRALRIGSAGKPSDIPAWERVLGNRIRGETGARVDVKNPSKEFQLVATPSGSFLGEVAWRAGKGRFIWRSPQKRPFFYAATLTPELAACMLNLARVRKGQIVLDPFCGAGAVLIECSLMGALPIGVDIAKRMVKGAAKNLEWAGCTWFGLAVGDARKLPIRQVDAVVTDPPYGKLSSTRGERPEALFSALLVAASDVLRSKGFLVTLSPMKVGIEEMAGKAGLECVESHPIYVHKRMTRELAVFRS
ncbi:MAG: methyltransferase domain-containing protein [Candidatus Brockarchaeota archaeon]|nr:methyltransferase domain-containing protein [Candidatus Brockarchaeota archaeon]